MVEKIRKQQILDLVKCLLVEYFSLLTEEEVAIVKSFYASIDDSNFIINSQNYLLPIVRKVWDVELKSGNYVVISWNKFPDRKRVHDLLFATLSLKDDIINAKTDKEAKASVSQLQGSLSKEITKIREVLLDLMADIEASIDYPEYDIEETSYQKANDVLNQVKNKLVRLENSFQDGKILRDGVKTVIVGKPNAGKSSLLNIMLDEERAIVSDYAGTTRDTIEEFIKIHDVPLKIIDTAGIRHTEDKI